MKVLLIGDSEELRSFLEQELTAHGAVLVHYWHPIKAMDNIDELAPEMVIFSGRDFPRHWKPFLLYFRAYNPYAEKVPFVLLRGENFPADEQKKADHLNVTAVIPEAFQSPEDLERLKAFVVSGRASVYRPAASEKAGILFTHPQNLTLIQGRINEISPYSLTFSPLSADACEGIQPSVVIRDCSLSIFHKLIAVDIEITEVQEDSFQARLLSGHDEIASCI